MNFRVIHTLPAAIEQCRNIPYCFLNVNSFYKESTKDKSFVHSFTTYSNITRVLFCLSYTLKSGIKSFSLQQKILFLIIKKTPPNKGDNYC